MRQPPEKAFTGASSSSLRNPTAATCAQTGVERAVIPVQRRVASAIIARRRHSRRQGGALAGRPPSTKSVAPGRSRARLLRHLADAPARRDLDVARVGLQPAREQAEQADFTGAVAPDPSPTFSRPGSASPGALFATPRAAAQRDTCAAAHPPPPRHRASLASAEAPCRRRRWCSPRPATAAKRSFEVRPSWPISSTSAPSSLQCHDGAAEQAGARSPCRHRLRHQRPAPVRRGTRWQGVIEPWLTYGGLKRIRS